ncbi:MAG TPA: hypothetical protein VFC00_21925 [Micromonosporaceae bacterium]|nr:hypothetical protein [Micromonosporaceae bacterium]
MAFDIDVYKHGAGPVPHDDLDFTAFAERPLSAGAVRCLRSMSDIESHTICYLRDLLVTPSHTDPTVTTFLTMWAVEEFWHGEALAKVLEAHGVPTGDAHIRAVRERLGWRDRWAPVQQALAANIVGVDFVAVHMTWGAINEWSTYAGYARLAALEDHPVLTELFGRIMRQETRHAAFYASQARERLERSRRAQKLTRFALRRFWAPVGTGLLPQAESAHLVSFLLGGEEGRRLVAQIDEKIDHLPGLAGLDLVRRAMRKYGL